MEEDGRRARSSRGENGVIQAAACILKTCGNVRVFKVWQFLNNLVRGEPGSQKIQHVRDTNAHPSYTWPPSALIWIHGNSVGNFHNSSIITLV